MNGVLHCTFRRTWHLLGNKKALLWASISLVGGTVLCFLVKGKEEALNEIEIILMYGIAPSLGATSVIFLWNLWLAPFRLLSERIESAIARSSDDASGSDRNSVDRADPKNWSNVPTLRIWQAADLCARDSPKDPKNRRTDGARAMFQQLVAAVQNGQLKTLPVKRFTAESHREVKREELQRYFGRIGDTPEFLRDP